MALVSSSSMNDSGAAKPRSTSGVCGFFPSLGNADVYEHSTVVDAIEKNVCRFDIAMDDAE